MIRRIVIAGALVLAAAAGSWLANACAPEFSVAVFSYKRHPDSPRTAFIDGRLGVLQPTFARSYLVIAYRYLNGIGLNPREREQARDYYKDREAWDNIGVDWPPRWRAVRARIKSLPPPPTLLITEGQLAYEATTHSFMLNCAEDAFRIAVHTLEARRSQFGANSPAFLSWVDAQDKVFQNCLGGPAVIPANAPSTLPALIRADRDYQIAAAHFYARDYQTALDSFRRIGHDAASPWRVISRYLVPRTLLRMNDYARLQTEAQPILADAGLISIRGMTWNLVERAGIRKRDQTYFRNLGLLLASKGQDNGLREELWNYTDIFDDMLGQERFRDADLSDWIYCFQSRDASVFSHSLSRWKQTRSQAWLLTALSSASPAAANSEGLLTAAAAIPESSPLYLTSRFHVLRIEEQLGDRSAAREELTQLLASPLLKDLPSSVNLFRGLRMLAAPTFEDFLQFAARKVVLVTVQTNYGEIPGYLEDGRHAVSNEMAERLDHDATRVLNRETPFRLLKRAALNDSLRAEMRGEALMTAFTRGLMLGEDLVDIASKMAATQPGLGKLARAYLAETSDDGRRFAAAFLLLHRPDARPYFGTGFSRQSPPGKLDDFRDNWWCPMDIPTELDSRATLGWNDPSVLQRSSDSVIPEFLTGDVAAEAKNEFAKLGELHAAADFLGSMVFPYAESHGHDPRIPEALHYLVRSAHYGCVDVNTWKVAREAFRLLHNRYPLSEWAKRTPTWFKNDYNIRAEIKSHQQ